MSITSVLATLHFPDWALAIVQNVDKHQGFYLVSLTFALVVIGLLTCSAASRNDKKRSRPYVIMEPLPGIFYGIRVSNIGLTSAKEITVVSEPSLRMVFPNYKKDISFIKKGVAYLPPRAKLETYIGGFEDIRSDNKAMIYKVKISYKDESGHGYVENFTLDYSLYEGLTLQSRNELSERIQDVCHAIDHLASGLHSRPVLVENYDEHMMRAVETIKTLKVSQNQTEIDKQETAPVEQSMNS